MNTFVKLQEEDRRLGILLLLSESTDYKANQFLILSALDTVYGHMVSMDRLRADLAWLAEQGLVTIADTGGVLVPELSGRGLDIAQGRANHPGVKRPRPS